MLVKITDAQGNTCQKDVAITVTGSGLDWSTLVWDQYVPFYVAIPPSGSGSGDSFFVDATGEAGNSVGFQGVHASLNYTGPSVNCILTINFTAWWTGSNLGIGVFQDGVLKLQILGYSGAIGIQTYPFTINAGISSLIEVKDNPFPLTTWVVVPPTKHDAYTGTFSNVP